MAETYPNPGGAPYAQQQTANQSEPVVSSYGGYGGAPYGTYMPPVNPGLSGGMKFGWLIVGLFMGLIGILLAWLANAGNSQQMRSDAVKFSAIGFGIEVVLFLLMIAAFAVVAGMAIATY